MLALIVSADRDTVLLGLLERTLRTRHGFAVTEVVAPDRAEVRCRADDPDVVFVVLSTDRPDATLDVVRHLRGIGVEHLLVVGPATDPKRILRLLQAGADLFLDQDELESELASAVARLRGEPAETQPGSLIAVLSAAGGCGASTVAVNLAALLASSRGKCHLIDLNPGKADLAPLLDLKPTYTLADLCRNDARLDRSMYDKLLVHHRTGIALLAAPREYADVSSITVRGVERALTLARESFTDVVVDLDDCFHAEQVFALQQATRIILVSRLDFTAVRNTRRIIDHITALGVPRERIEVVMNHTGLPNELPFAEAEMAIGSKLTHSIPHDPATLFAANNIGIPAAVTATGSAVVQAIARIVGLDTPHRHTPLSVGNIVRSVRETVAPRLQAIRARLTTAPTVVEFFPAEDTKVCHESIFAPQFGTGDTRPLPAGTAARA